MYRQLDQENKYWNYWEAADYFGFLAELPDKPDDLNRLYDKDDEELKEAISNEKIHLNMVIKKIVKNCEMDDFQNKVFNKIIVLL